LLTTILVTDRLGRIAATDATTIKGDGMNDDEMNRKLNSVGKAAFVEYFSTFKSYADGKRTRKDCIAELVENGVSRDDAGAGIRCGNAKLLFDHRRQCDALNVIAASTRVPAETIRMAQQLINRYCK
jgi:hypothetical protein